MEDLQKEFIPYELALRMKQLEFDEECLAIYSNANPKTGLYTLKKYRLKLIKQASQKDKGVKAPTFSQVFRWFREKYNLFGKLEVLNFGADEYCFEIYDLFEEKTIYDNFIGAGASYTGTFDTYEEAELACLEKLCEIIEQKT
jgi:hypothetical protein